MSKCSAERAFFPRFSPFFVVSEKDEEAPVGERGLV
jgi:hypothetical protein